MAAFSYVAIDVNGKQNKGVLEADSARQARQLLRDKGLTPIEVNVAVSKSSGQSYLTGWFALRLSGTELASVTRQLATLVEAGLPIADCLNIVSQQTENPKARSLLMSVRTRVLEGHSLAASMGEYPHAFPEMYRATVSAGESSGHLDLVLEHLADYVEAAQASRQRIQLAMLYPAILFVVAVMVVSGLMVYVVPDVVEVFIGQGQELPALTKALIGLSDFVVNWGLLITLALVGAISGFSYALKSQNFRMEFDRKLLGMPLVGKISRGFNTARFSSTLSILTSSGVPLVDAMKIAGEVLSNMWLQEKMKETTRQVREGSSLKAALERSGYFPPMMIHMIGSGEASGTIDKMLARVAASQQRTLDSLIAVMLGLLEPLMLLFMGASVLLIVVAILLPIFNLNTLI